ncbi:hypothetical protein [Arthrobacter mangrovi]|uniref:Uncharacterized protein n=1 Tax=Arthrobacter mangrovi TaxID=2966350 RepID=A0ABQ5MPL7_9MICC|nr:hypothetical protein [Arthrobacter mangrovi]GLB65934.1 hypothetical protein AHIS1636_03730 [Arthrobacter mangrovi]
MRLGRFGWNELLEGRLVVEVGLDWLTRTPPIFADEYIPPLPKETRALLLPTLVRIPLLEALIRTPGAILKLTRAMTSPPKETLDCATAYPIGDSQDWFPEKTPTSYGIHSLANRKVLTFS